MEKERRVEDRLALFKVVKALVENEGRLTGSSKAENAVRAILVPYAANAADITDADLPLASEIGFNPLTPNTPSFNTQSSSPVATYTVLPSHIEKIHSILLCGEKKKALKYTIDRKLWAHAFVIASAVDQEAWKEVAQEFIKHELGAGPGGSNGKESLRVAYSLFAGAGANSIQEFLPPRPLNAGPTFGSHLSANGPNDSQPVATPMSSNFPDLSLYSNISNDVLDKWRETAAMIISNQPNGDSATLTALGDTLGNNGWNDAAHVWFVSHSPPRMRRC
ncbi:hypothetical protein BT69DRAFT_1344126 [Atractiella rhizophila]|nr:hypothetical protein BT69DRAFT_1344126 [Atractiella rhizophila]